MQGITFTLNGIRAKRLKSWMCVLLTFAGLWELPCCSCELAYEGLCRSLYSQMTCDWAAIVLLRLLSQNRLLFPGCLAAVAEAKLLRIKLHCLHVLAAGRSECELGLRVLSYKSVLHVHRNLSNDSQQLQMMRELLFIMKMILFFFFKSNNLNVPQHLFVMIRLLFVLVWFQE